MRNLKNKSGFTLLEILVVIIIVGVLASVAMPTLFRNVERSRATEALNALGMAKRAMDACSMQFNGVYSNCNSWNAIGMQDPSTSPGTHFTYSAPNVTAPAAWSITATRNATNQGDGASQITLNYNAGTVTRQGTGAFQGIQ